VVLVATQMAKAQVARITSRMDATQIVVGDQARLFIEIKINSRNEKLFWATIPDSFPHLEVLNKGKIDTVKDGDTISYRQRLLITGFDSGLFTIPQIPFKVKPIYDSAYTITTSAFQLLVQTVDVDTTKAFKPIKDIMKIKGSWLDYIWYILSGALFMLLAIFIVTYFIRNKKVKTPPPAAVPESLQQKTIRLLAALEEKMVWQKGDVKEYYTELTDIVRNYIELRFKTPAMELTTDELLHKASMQREMMPVETYLRDILYTADMAKFAKSQPLPQEHVAAMEKAIKLVVASKPLRNETQQQQ
jgi:hypothetical protein